MTEAERYKAFLDIDIREYFKKGFIPTFPKPVREYEKGDFGWHARSKGKMSKFRILEFSDGSNLTIERGGEITAS